MANLARSAKSGNNWTADDLQSYHISLNEVDLLQFFGLQVGQGFGIPHSLSSTFPPAGIAATLGRSRTIQRR